jgi:hypothetical protein
MAETKTISTLLTLTLHACPHCGVLIDAHSGAPGTKPKAGDVSICFHCFEISIFMDQPGARRKPTAEEHAKSMAYPEVRDVIAHVKAEHAKIFPDAREATTRALGRTEGRG